MALKKGRKNGVSGMRKKLLICIMCLTLAATGCGSQKPSKEEKTSTTEKPAAEAVTQLTTEYETQPATEPGTQPATETTIQQTTQPPIDYSTHSMNAVATMAFTGDIYFSDKLYGYYEQNGLIGFISEKVINTLRNADIYVADHEYASGNCGTKADYQIYTYHAPLERESLWVEMGADVITVANNHTMDYGEEALVQTCSKLKELGMDVIGGGSNLEEALKPSIRVVNGKKIAIFGSTRFVPRGSWYATNTKPGLLTTYESTDYYGYVCNAITQAKQTCDYVAVYTHFGIQDSTSVAQYQKNIAHGYMDAGADLVVGTHPHVLEGIEFYNGRPIIYSIGNFLFENYHSDTVVLNAIINDDNSTTIQLLPCSSQKYQTVDLEGEAARNLFNFIESISFDVKIDDNGIVTPK